jgi:hypothetical protein
MAHRLARLARLAGLALLTLAFSGCGDRSPPPAAAGTGTRSSSAAMAAAEAPALPTPAGRGDVALYSAAQLARVAEELAKGSTTGRTIGGHPTYRYVVARRVASGEPEVHDGWIDVTIVQAGRATLLTGGRVDGGRLASAGEHRGGTIAGGARHAVASGDLFVVPAGIPHQFLVAQGDSLRYLTLKVIRPAGGH